ncbi:oxidoreductase [Ferrimonas sp. YFM]|uniref:oxidoreductase n=1 Tax=Ferrimonas sp. YFM TaxID=3028878 RepID=UPI002572A0A6|nr:oxidoreductase [Ferrimonas sp. YFM]BDY06964.1 putative short-chain dehydrogenase/reductase [Ferrimonas sp. YFM]
MTTTSLPDLQGKIAVVTGGNIGLGFESSLQLARAGALVVIACRDNDKGERARTRILHHLPRAQVEVLPLDLTCAETIDRFSQAFAARHPRLDLLLNNAGVVNLESLRHTHTGREMHMATNHLGHFALTGRLMPQLLAAPQARVVTVSSGGYKWGVIDFDDLDWHTRPYHRVKSYGDSKLANLLFMDELQRRFEALGSTALSLAAHPGLTATERQQSIGIGGRLSRCLATPVSKGVRPQLVAATAPEARGGDFWGPAFGLWGAPKRHSLKAEILDREISQRLWSLSEQLTGVHYPE